MIEYTAALIALEHGKMIVEKLDAETLVIPDLGLTAKQVIPQINTAIDAVKSKIAMPVHVRRRESYFRPDFYCPVCGKQQKDSFKNAREDCYCERCGQRLTF